MRITYFCPTELEKNTAAGVIMEAELLPTKAFEYIGFSVPLEPVEKVHERGAIWLMTHLPDEFPVFLSHQAAIEFLAFMWIGMQTGLLTPDLLGAYVDINGGIWRNKSDYALERVGRSNLN